MGEGESQTNVQYMRVPGEDATGTMEKEDGTLGLREHR